MKYMFCGFFRHVTQNDYVTFVLLWNWGSRVRWPSERISTCQTTTTTCVCLCVCVCENVFPYYFLEKEPFEWKLHKEVALRELSVTWQVRIHTVVRDARNSGSFLERSRTHWPWPSGRSTPTQLHKTLRASWDRVTREYLRSQRALHASACARV